MTKSTFTAKQQSFSQVEYEAKKKRTRRDIFLARMEDVVPWSRLLAVIEPHSPKSGRRGRPPIGLGCMLRMYFIKAHIGVDDESGWVHTVVSTAAHVSDISQTVALMHGEETRMGADAGYVGVLKRDEVQQKLQGMPRAVRWHIAKRRAPIRKMAEGWQKDLALAHEKLKARLRVKVEHPFHVIKNIFKHKKTRYQGLPKNAAQIDVLFALGNLYMARGKLCPT